MKVSIIVPFYNSQENISDCVSSLINQTYSNVEIILVDDGSIDKSYNNIKSYLDKHSIKYLKQNNKGVSAARNLGISYATGEYIIFVDSDDYIELNAVEILMQSLSDQADLVHYNMSYVYENSKIKKNQRVDNGVYDIEDFRNRLIDDGTLSGILFGSVCTAIYSRRIIQENNIIFPENVKVNEDGIFNLLYFSNINKIKIIDNYLYNYRQETKEKVIREDKIIDDLDKATQTIVNLHDKGVITVSDFDIQIKRREVSVTLWKNLFFCDSYNMQNFRQIHTILKRINNINLNLEILNDVPLFKRYYVFLIKYRLNLLIYISIKYINPIMTRFISR